MAALLKFFSRATPLWLMQARIRPLKLFWVKLVALISANDAKMRLRTLFYARPSPYN
jgi:hypothetical protein